jgi:hypothetical protein
MEASHIVSNIEILNGILGLRMSSPGRAGSESLLLPPEIQKMIKRKSSHDPLSRFSNKLHILLMYAGEDLAKQASIGAGWIYDTSFRLNKKRLVIVMEIKQNTLNVNLKDLKFHLLEPETSGWAVWKRPGFTRQSTIEELVDLRADKVPEKLMQSLLPENTLLVKLALSRDMSFGFTDPPAANLSKRLSFSMWEEIGQTAGQYPVDPDEFHASCQKLDDSLRILQAIFVCADPTPLKVLDFAKFMAKFGS